MLGKRGIVLFCLLFIGWIGPIPLGQISAVLQEFGPTQLVFIICYTVTFQAFVLFRQILDLNVPAVLMVKNFCDPCFNCFVELDGFTAVLVGIFLFDFFISRAYACSN